MNFIKCDKKIYMMTEILIKIGSARIFNFEVKHILFLNNRVGFCGCGIIKG